MQRLADPTAVDKQQRHHVHNEVGVEDAIQHHAGIGVVDNDGRKDWHDWEAIAREELRTGRIFID